MTLFAPSAAQAPSTTAVRHGAYLFLSLPAASRRSAAATQVDELAERLDLHNEFGGVREDEPRSIAYVRRTEVIPAGLADAGISQADALIHVASSVPEPLAAFCSALQDLLGGAGQVRTVDGVVAPLYYTSRAMAEFAYAHRVLPRPAAEMPNAFVVPLRKSAAWWAKGWMERQTYFLPRFDDAGRMLNQGHALAAEAGIPCLLRRTYRYPTEPAPEGAYDFVSYFECADADVDTFHEVCTALRDTERNPEWAYVQEGPTWRGRRVATWGELFD